MPRKSHPQEPKKKQPQHHPPGWYPAGPAKYPPGFHGHPYHDTRQPRHHPRDELMTGMMDMGKMAVGGMVMVGTLGVVGSIIRPPGS